MFGVAQAGGAGTPMGAVGQGAGAALQPLVMQRIQQMMAQRRMGQNPGAPTPQAPTTLAMGGAPWGSGAPQLPTGDDGVPIPQNPGGMAPQGVMPPPSPGATGGMGGPPPGVLNASPTPLAVGGATGLPSSILPGITGQPGGGMTPNQMLARSFMQPGGANLLTE